MTSKAEQLAGMASYLADEIAKILERTMKTCINCEHFNEEDEFCMIARNGPARPPAKIIALGCDAFSEKVPF